MTQEIHLFWILWMNASPQNKRSRHPCIHHDIYLSLLFYLFSFLFILGYCSWYQTITCWRRHWRRSGIFIVNFEHISHLVIVFLLLTLNMNWRLGVSRCFLPVFCFLLFRPVSSYWTVELPQTQPWRVHEAWLKSACKNQLTIRVNQENQYWIYKNFLISNILVMP